MRRLRHHGSPPGDVDMPTPASNYRLSDIQCAVGIPQLRRLDELLAARRARRRGLRGAARRLPSPFPRRRRRRPHGWQAYVVQVDRRDDVLAALRAQGIEAQIGTYALHLLAAYRDQGAFPGADAPSSGRSRCRSTRGSTEADLDRVAEAP